MPRLLCPMCQQEFVTEQSAYMPFCSRRCKMIDLGRWLGEEYSMPVERPAELEAYRQREESD